MDIYFGGAYNGKLNYVKEKYKIEDKDIFYCKDSEIDFSKRVICGIHKFIYYNALNNKESVEYFKNNIEKFKDKIIICDEISSGIVPIKKEERLWREDTGKVMKLLTQESNLVCKIFFGIPMVIKNE
ncbi:bifunctional adenosylcobinamide kinase/adenosylcobinamide-phosphate guanylyltransferase [Clostridium baratii]|uniref:bifunctional adenosylcobinamide kinase/adenosylcobinamide-phosphate guanylyltransferase n=1 Tax=Clostridium baratii TaxID=1561 RepID=UPI0005F2A5A5|nr:bifunctional adenosylcobinamide kinase/adenosylcobinamide-phosphate guanylyltransferase [Clostridium baratii]KJU71096.1 cobalamin biosynthesis protein CobU [Clostridium baratii]